MAEQPPICLGKLWEAQHPECAGGPDPAFTNPHDGSSVRPKCPWFAQCAATTNANRLAASNNANNAHPNPIAQNMPVKINPQGPIASVARGVVQGIANVAAQQQMQQQQMQQFVPRPMPPIPAPQQQVPVRVVPQTQYYPQQMPQQYMQQMPQQQYGQVPMVPPQVAMMPYQVPMNMQAPGMHMMGYLAVPEPMVDGQHWASRLGFSVLRSMFKASGHTVANFFDFNTFTAYPHQGG